tara:strand:+ start:892 stop:1800 length:909 start_codon:yes stop_codon:yes gene_type:complete
MKSVNSLKNGIKYILTPCHQGQSRSGVERGGSFIYNKTEYPRTVISQYEFETKPDINKKWEPNYKNKIINWNGYNILKNNVIDSLKNNITPFILGGDHSISLGSVAGSLDYYKGDLTTIWVDAHADINTHESSPSGNLHGMPLAYLTGLEKTKTNTNINNNTNNFEINYLLDFKNLIYIGLRDLDPFEEEVINKYNIQYITSSNLLKNKSLLDKFIINSKNIHLSVDVDVLDPEFMPCTGTLVENGINLQLLQYVIKWVQSKGNIVSTDLVEFNPNINNNKLYMAVRNCYRILDSIHYSILK